MKQQSQSIGSVRPKNDQKVAVAYLHPSDVAARFHRSMLNMVILDAQGAKLPDGTKIGGRGRIINGGAVLDYSSGAQITKTRNRAARDFLALDGIDWMLMLDADMTFTPDLLEMLITVAHPTERPIVGGLCFAYMLDQSRRFWPTLYSHVPGTSNLRRLTQYPADSMIQVAATGAACLLVHRSVLETMGERFPAPWPWFAETPFFQTDPDTGEKIPGSEDAYSEDITFCLRAQAAGFPVHVHTGIKLGHVKSFEADEDAFIAESEMLREASVPALPTFAVIASKNRPEMLATLRAQLEGQTTDVFVFDNGYETPPERATDAHDWPLHRMWNYGIDVAASQVDGPFNVLIINDDVEVPNELCARLEAALRADEGNWIAYPDDTGTLQPGVVVCTDHPVRSLTGWCFMLRGESGLRLDERFVWWYGDADLEQQAQAAGKHVVRVGGAHARHLDPVRSTMENPTRLAQAEADEVAFAEKWGLNADSLWLAQHRAVA